MKKNMNEVFSTNLRNALYMAGKTKEVVVDKDGNPVEILYQ